MEQGKKDITTPRFVYKPFEYPQAAEFWLKQQQVHWLHTEVPLAQDLNDWNLNLQDHEKEIIGGILKGFAQTETLVEDYWSGSVAKWFKKPEIGAMARTFGSFECFDKETELLTSEGWVKCPNITENHSIAQYDIESKKISFVKPKKVVSYDYDGLMHSYKSKCTDICVTPNHDLITIHPFSRKVTKRKSFESKLGRNYLYPSAGFSKIETNHLSPLERLLIAAQADGSFRGLCPSEIHRNCKTCLFALSKEKKITRLISLLNEAKIEYKTSPRTGGQTNIWFDFPNCIDINAIKNMSFLNLSEISSNKAREIIEEALKWDGSRNQYYYNTNEEAIDKIQAVSVLGGISCTKGINRTSDQTAKIILPQGGNPKSHKTCYVLTFRMDMENRTYPHKKEIEYKDKVYCVSVDTENLVSRRNGRVAITGNTIHAAAYALLNETLGLDNFAEFLEDEETKAKIDSLLAINLDAQDDWSSRAQSLAIFSGFTEGVNLYSSFAVLLSFKLRNLLKGVGQIIEWSVRDESCHSDGGCWLFRQLISEKPELKTKKLVKNIEQAGHLALELEFKFIDKIFRNGDLENLKKDELKNFMRHRVNTKMVDLSLEPIIPSSEIDAGALKQMKWFDSVTAGQIQTDFFGGRVTNYSKGQFNWDDAF